MVNLNFMLLWFFYKDVDGVYVFVFLIKVIKYVNDGSVSVEFDGLYVDQYMLV